MSSSRPVPRETYGGSPSYYILLVPILSFLAVVAAAAIVAAGVFAACRFYRSTYLARIRCLICGHMVRKRDWKDHRSDCAQRHRDLISGLPEPFDIRCPGCLAYLKLVPKDFPNGSFRPSSFLCDSLQCPFSAGRIINNGYNRLHCFNCDYDMCDSCVHRRLFVLTKINYNNQAAGCYNNGFQPETAEPCRTCQLEGNTMTMRPGENLQQQARPEQCHLELLPRTEEGIVVNNHLQHINQGLLGRNFAQGVFGNNVLAAPPAGARESMASSISNARGCGNNSINEVGLPTYDETLTTCPSPTGSMYI